VILYILVVLYAMKVYIGADHRGFDLKEKIAKWLFEMGHEFEDLGANKLDPKDDYTKYAKEVASLVADNRDSRAVLVCGSGVGMDIAANKFDGVRASVGKSSKQVAAGRNDDDMNILVIAADYTKENEAKEMLMVFLETRFSGKARHERRLEDISRLEKNN
jgi:ribose 5-phosphate isomerase B